jgi:putative RNA 2'-phosphotransferase
MIGAALDSEGWLDVEELIAKTASQKHPFTKELLDEIVRTDNKQRYSYSADGKKIRANQGHSLGEVDIKFEEKAPPEVLFHGTVQESIDPIMQQGIRKMQRNYVHLSSDYVTATKVGGRRGEPVVLRVLAGEMHKAGYKFFLSDNGVWLTYHVPSQFIDLAL